VLVVQLACHSYLGCGAGTRISGFGSTI